MRKILLVWLTLFVALCAVEGAAIVAVKRVQYLFPICEISVVDIVALGVLQIGNPAWPYHLVPDLADCPLHGISGAGRFESARLRAQNPFNEARAGLTRTRSNGILSRLTAGSAAEFEGFFDGDSRVGSVVSLHDRYQPVQLGQFSRLLAFDERSSFHQIFQSSFGQLNARRSGVIPRGGLQVNPERNLLEVLNERQTRLCRMSIFGPSASAHRVSVAVAFRGSQKGIQFVIYPLLLEFVDKGLVVLVHPPDEISYGRFGQFVDSAVNRLLQFFDRTVVLHRLPQIRACSCFIPLSPQNGPQYHRDIARAQKGDYAPILSTCTAHPSPSTTPLQEWTNV